MSEGKPTDVVLDPSQCVHIIDATKGTVECHVGPCRLDLAEKDRPVRFDGKEYQRCRSVEHAIQSFPVANEGDYIELMNPAKDDSHPPCGKVTGAAELVVGRSVVIPGPASFPLWPGQVARVIKGHQLRSNQYLVARVINEKDAKANWNQKVATAAGEEENKPNKTDVVNAADLTMGTELVIKGTDVSFFIPPTGIAVVTDSDGNYVRDAVTLETVEYCVLRDEDGNKRYVRGPDVVFPEPTEQFVTTENDGKTSRKFRAVELSEISGIHVKVIADYKEGDEEYKEGDELFITGTEQGKRIYFPRPEHAIIKYGNSERHFAVAIPAGEARYVLDRLNGEIDTLKGPTMSLLDPTKKVFVKRILDEKTVDLWFPGNVDAKQYNAKLEQIRAHVGSKELGAQARGSTRSMSKGISTQALSDVFSAAGSNFVGDVGDVQASYAHSERAVEEFGGDEIKRKDTFTPPRTITLDTKYEGAVTVRVWTGFAVQVVSSTGEREVVVGPYPRILNYDEMLEIVSLSTSERGAPKSFRNPLRTPYLRVKNNRVSDVIKAQTSDLVDVSINVSYRVNFEGNKDKWFNVENYVGLLCERGRSILRGKIKKLSIREFMADSVTIVRDALLGTKPESADGDTGPSVRAGLKFDENDMHLYDVEVLDTTIGNSFIASEIEAAQHAIVTNEIGLEKDKQRLNLTMERQKIQQQIDEAETATRKAEIRNQRAIDLAEAERAEEAAKHALEAEQRETEIASAQESTADLRAISKLQRRKNEEEQSIEMAEKAKAVELAALAQQTKAFIERMGSIQPNLIAALQVHGDKVLMSEMMKDLGVMAALTGDSIDGVYKKLMEGSVLADVFTGNGGANAGIAAGALRRSGLKSEIEK